MRIIGYVVRDVLGNRVQNVDAFYLFTEKYFAKHYRTTAQKILTNMEALKLFYDLFKGFPELVLKLYIPINWKADISFLNVEQTL